ncbi:zf-TFIIB domain-containing protein [Pedobacter gandavensis]|uniref:TFIIB-type zinc ribbon-containing protein n=1 Tax=Pedobacter gandavensis TaxID=2679963 RepID=UPI0039773BD0
MTVRNNVEIDYCPKCRGIWLDRGELDKLLAFDQDKNTSTNSYNKDNQSFRNDSFTGHDQRNHEQRNHDQRNHDQRGHGNNSHGYPKKKKSFLEDLFDF